MKAAIRAGVMMFLVMAGCSSLPEGLREGLAQAPVVMRGLPPLCGRTGPVTYSQTIDATDELRIGTNNRVLVTADAGAVRAGEEVTVTLNVHNSSSLTFDLFVEGEDSYDFESDLTIRINTATCRNVTTNPFLIQIGEGGHGTVTLSPQSGNSQIFTGTVRSLSLFLLSAPG